MAKITYAFLIVTALIVLGCMGYVFFLCCRCNAREITRIVRDAVFYGQDTPAGRKEERKSSHKCHVFRHDSPHV